MDPEPFVLIFLFWLFLIVMHYFLINYEFNSYINFIREIGISVNYFHVKFVFSNFNRKLFKRTSKKLFYQLYRIGSYFTIITIPIAIVIIFITMKSLIIQVLNNIILKTNAEAEESLMTLKPVLPGINLPLTHLPYFLISLAIVTFVHEYGHAIAANLLDIRVFQTGLSFYFLIPVAFVQMSSEDMEKVSVKRRIMVASAGIFNNYILTVICFLLLIINPTLLSIFYSTNNGIYVYSVDESSPIHGQSGLKSGDILLSVNNDCKISDINSFNECLKDLLKQPISGYCVSLDFIEQHKFNFNGRCCTGAEPNAMCFKQIKISLLDKFGINTKNILDSFNKLSLSEKLCLPVRQVINSYKKRCFSITDCTFKENNINLIDNIKNETTLNRCIIPISVTQRSQIIEVERAYDTKFIFFGYSFEVGKNILVTNYVPRLPLFSVWLVVIYENILKYTASFSLTLALLNLAPCYYLDGYLLLNNLLELIIGNDVENSFKSFLLHLIVGIGTFIISITLVAALLILFQISGFYT